MNGEDSAETHRRMSYDPQPNLYTYKFKKKKKR